MCRRILATLVSISYRSLSKGEIQKPEKFVKLMEVGNNYMEQWHQNLLTFSIRTNTKFTHLQGVLDEISVQSDNEDINKSMYSRQNSRNSRVNSPAPSRTHAIKHDRQSVLLGQIRTHEKKDASDNLDSSYTEVEPNIQLEDLSANDLNSEHSFRLNIFSFVSCKYSHLPSR